jgi:uncharacterized protein YbaP (TraB family)
MNKSLLRCRAPWRSGLGIFAALLLFAVTARAEPAMWVIKDKNSTIYLIGTIHLLRHDMEWDAAKVKKTVGESTELWLEIADADNQANLIPVMQKYGFDRENPLSGKLNAAQKEKLTKVAAAYNLPLAVLEPMRPWTAGLIFAVLPLQKAGYDPNAGVDRILKTQAEKEGDKIFGFETAEEQVRFLADLPETDQIAFLEESLDDAEKGLALLDKLATAWLAGDTETIGHILVDELKTKSPALYDKLVVQRNVRWAGKIAEILKRPGVRQIAVGTAHLAGPDSLQVQLAKRGIKVEPY